MDWRNPQGLSPRLCENIQYTAIMMDCNMVFCMVNRKQFKPKHPLREIITCFGHYESVCYV